jgi:UDP-N-acetylmuramate dehydrogenase
MPVSKKEMMKKLINGMESDDIIFDMKSAGLTSIKTGGRVLCYLVADTRGDLKKIVRFCNENGIYYMMIGDGTNILFNDRYLDLVLIKLGKDFKYVDFSCKDRISAGAGFRLFRMIVLAADRGYDFSELSGIPGTVGGAVISNSGAGDKGICDFIEKITYMTVENGNIKEKNIILKKSDFGYRNLNLPDVLVMTGVVFKTRRSGRDEIFSEIRSRIKKRKLSQPAGTCNAGCFFKNVREAGESSGSLIEKCGMKGFMYGGARVSRKHANFIENFNNASSEDIFVLSNIVRDKVMEKFKVGLEYEVKLIGFQHAGYIK